MRLSPSTDIVIAFLPMGDEGTRKTVRELLTEIDQSGRVSVESLIDLAANTDRRVTIDRSDTPPIVYVEAARSSRFDALSPREREVAGLVAAGRTNQEIADALYISLATVKDHVHAVLVKTGLRNRTSVVTAWHGASD
jgi:DNA-binding NarL/FixJ family response regulator